jgi:hypothetical protein
MSIRTAILTGLIFCCVNVFSQLNYSGAELVVGVKGGVTISSIAFEPIMDNQNHLMGMIAGGLFRYSGEKYLAIQIEANYFQCGWQENNLYSRQLSYVQIPVLTHIFFGRKNFRAFVNLGPNVAVLVGDKISGDSISGKGAVEPVKRRFDYGILAGAGIELHTKSGIYQIEGRYNFGLGDVFINNPSDTFRRSAHRNIVVTFGYLFDVKKKRGK